MKKFLILLLLLIPINLNAQVVDHNSIYLFNSLTTEQINQAQDTKLLFVDRSVGWNINTGLDCLGTLYATAKTSCKRYKHIVSVYNNVPEIWTGTYPRTNFTFFGHSGVQPILPCNTGENLLTCFSRYVEEHPEYTTVCLMPSYLLEFNAGDYINTMRQIQLTGRTVILATSSLARSSGSNLTVFNAAVRNTSGFPILDVADIESHDQDSQAWYDNRDGVYYSNGNCQENYSNDGINTEAVSPHYTSECDGGHLSNPDVGKIRIAKAIWILLAGL